jgi:hypothetical protein
VISYGDYPQLQSKTIEQNRPFVRADFDEALRDENTVPELVYVTPDPEGLAGWVRLLDYVY